MDWKTVAWSVTLLAGLTNITLAQSVSDVTGAGWIVEGLDSEKTGSKPESAGLPESAVVTQRGNSSATLFSWSGEKNQPTCRGPWSPIDLTLPRLARRLVMEFFR